jgi:hypothetical protein
MSVIGQKRKFSAEAVVVGQAYPSVPRVFADGLDAAQ